MLSLQAIPDNAYRLHFLILLGNLFGPPAFVTWALLHFILPPAVTSSLFFRSLCGVFTCLGYWTVKFQWTQSKNARDAARLGAVLPPRMNGKWIGNIDIVLDSVNTFKHGYALENIRRYLDTYKCDTMNLGLLWQDVYVTRNHHVTQNVLATGFDNFEKGSELRILGYGLFGTGIFLADGVKAKAHRAMARPFFARERVRDFDLFGRYTDKVLAHFGDRARVNESIDVQDVFGRFTLDTAGEFLFGTDSLNTLDLPLPIPGKAILGVKGTKVEGVYGGFVNSFEQLQAIMAVRCRWNKLWPAREFFKDQSEEHNTIVDEFIRPLVLTALEKKKARGVKSCGVEEGNLIDHLADATTDVCLIRHELFNILLAARDTTASLLTFVTYVLCLYPNVAAKLRDEVLLYIPRGAPTFEHIRRMKYLRAVLNETLRLYPSVPWNGRVSTVASLFPGDANTDGKPIYVPGGGIRVNYFPIFLHRRKDLWGDDAEEFNPERWIDRERVQKMTADPFMFLPFSAGPRICLGQNFAYNEASFVIIRVLQMFDTFTLRQKEDAPAGSCPPDSWKNAGGRKAVEQVWTKSAVTLYSKGGLWVRMGLAES